MRLGLVSPSAPAIMTLAHQEQFANGIAHLKRMGFDIAIGDHALSNAGYRSSSITDRIADIHAMLASPKVDALIATNGGWISADLLRFIDWTLVRMARKPLVGFSDITTLLQPWRFHAQAPGILGPMVVWGFDNTTIKTDRSFRDALSQFSQTFSIDTFGAYVKTQPKWVVSGPIVAGNLTTLATLLGTPYAPRWEKSIFFWEDVTESTWRLERLLTHFSNAGIWDKINGMVIGHLDHIDEQYHEQTSPVWEMIEQFFAPYSFPIIRTSLFGHAAPEHLSIPIGGWCILSKDEIRISPITSLQD